MTRNSLTKDVARVIRAVLTIRGIHQADFANTIGQGTSNVSRWLKGATFNTDTLELMADGLGMEVADLVSLAKTSRGTSDAELIALVASIEANRGRSGPPPLRAVDDVANNGA